MTAGGSRLPLALATVAVAFAAADTYVVVMALPDMMASAGVPLDQLQRGAPIVSGFLLGYVAMLPLIGRIADLRGRVPVLVAALVLFALGSLVTALAYDLPVLVTGRFLQGVGGGGLVPATLALVADLYPVNRRSVPLGIVSAVQELGSVLGPLVGAVILALSDWRMIFAVNLAVGALLAVALRRVGDDVPLRRPDPVGLGLTGVVLAGGILLFVEPSQLLADVTWGAAFVPVWGSGRWLTPLGLAVIGAAVLWVLRSLLSRRPLVDLRGWWASMRSADLPGATLLGLSLAGVILAFATADPKVEVFSSNGWLYLTIAAVAAVAFVWHLRRAQAPLVPRGALRATPAWGSLLVSFFVGSSLIAALIDIPIFARTTVYPDSQLLAALVLVRLLVALPIGAVAGGHLVRHLSPGVVTAIGMAAAAVGFVWMSRWGVTSIGDWTATVPLVLTGLGFGLALAPVNSAVLASTDDDVHGLASALVVVARMVGMLVGISALTTIGLRRYYAASADIPPPMQVCGHGRSACDAFDNLLRVAGIAQEHTVFLGAATCAAIAAALALLLYRRLAPFS